MELLSNYVEVSFRRQQFKSLIATAAQTAGEADCCGSPDGCGCFRKRTSTKLAAHHYNLLEVSLIIIVLVGFGHNILY